MRPSLLPSFRAPRAAQKLASTLCERFARAPAPFARLLASGALACLSSCYMVKSSDTFYGLDTARQRVVFVVDVSGSMEGKDEGSLRDRVMGAATASASSAVGGALGGTLGAFVSKQAASESTKLGGAKRELIPALQGLPDSSSFAIITFGDKAEPWFRGMVPATRDNRTLAAGYVKQLEANGGTPARSALEAAFAYGDAGLIFFLSDGQPTDASQAEILQTVGQLNQSHRVVVSTIGLGDDQDERFLRTLAAQNGGRYVKK